MTTARMTTSLTKTRVAAQTPENDESDQIGVVNQAIAWFRSSVFLQPWLTNMSDNQIRLGMWCCFVQNRKWLKWSSSVILVAPHCAIPRDYLSDPIARYGVSGVSTWPIGCDTPSPFSERFPLGEHAKWRCDTPPPPTKGLSQRYLRDTLWKQGKWVRYPPLRYYLEKVLRDMGGVTRTGQC